MGDINTLKNNITIEQKEALRTLIQSYDPTDKVIKLYLSDESLFNLAIDSLENSFFGIAMIETLLGIPLFNLYLFDSYLQLSELYSKSDLNYIDRKFKIYPDGQIEEIQISLYKA